MNALSSLLKLFAQPDLGNNILPKDLVDRLKAGEKLQVVDVRTPVEYAYGHIRGAANIPLDRIRDELPGIGRDQAVVLVCQVGSRSIVACRRVMDTHTAVLNLAGGMSAWIRAGYGVEMS